MVSIKKAIKSYLIHPEKNYIQHLHTLKNEMNGLRQFFNCVIIETTTYCNRKCHYCPNSLFRRGVKSNEQLLSTKVFHKIIKELKELNFTGTILTHHYGEPLLDSRLFELIKYGKQNLPNCLFGVHTNGDYLTPQLLPLIEEAKADFIFITEHSSYPNTRIENILKLVKNHTCIYYYRSLNNKPLFNRGGLFSFNNEYSFNKCLLPARSLTINASADVILCCNDYQGEICFGNLQSERIQKIWNKPQYKKIRNETSKGIFKKEICQKCTKTNATK
ncbi:MAG: SPASM domain-containing protein [Bacteriovoracaceae bacterium]|jgi:2-deoxy-scyllo-inosamine dehydrogenase (SAM-dependent)|nr:SPASM domain-containing protein [Bacteriovoracaceae bacterium]